MRRLLRADPDDRWAAVFGRIAVYSFLVALVSGILLLPFFQPSMTPVVYHGSYRKLDGLTMSHAYQSTLNISFDVRGGLLIRQVHHWSADLFVAAVCLRLIRVFFRGRFRRSHWLIWVGLLLAGMLAGFSGAILPDDMLSGGSLSVFTGVILSLPLVGTHAAMLIFGGSIPGHVIIPRDYWLHIVVLPAVLGGLLLLSYRGRRLQPFRVRARSTRCCRSPLPCWSRSARSRRSTRCGCIGPYQPGSISSGSVPDWYMGFLDGALRLMPSWELSIGGHPLVAGRADPRGDRARAVLHAGRRVPAAGRLDRRRPPATRPAAAQARRSSEPDRRRCGRRSRCTGCCGPRPRTTRSPTTCRSRCTR